MADKITEMGAVLMGKDRAFYQDLGLMLQKAGVAVRLVQNEKALEEVFEQGTFGVLVFDWGIQAEPFEDALSDFLLDKGVQSLALAARSDMDTCYEAMKLGLSDFLTQPFRKEDIHVAVRKLMLRSMSSTESSAQNGHVQASEAKITHGSHGVAHKSGVMSQLLHTIEKIADFKTTCLILGESGTGKELLAQAIHDLGIRHKEKFVTVNCGAIPENLLESELFGHVKGAFTGAVAEKKGLFQEAHKGTLFLDEIGELPLLLQVKLLRVLQEEEIRPVGATQSLKVDVRIVAATMRNLEEEVEMGHFREDLYYRLNVLPLHVPALRDRKEDIPVLIEHFLGKMAKTMNSSVREVSPEAMKAFMLYPWPGNVRELENMLERSLIMTQGDILKASDLPAQFQDEKGGSQGAVLGLSEDELSIKKLTRELERTLIRRALTQTEGNRTQAAKVLEISHRALLYKIKEYELDL